MKKKLLTTKQIAKYLQVDVETVRRYVRKKELPSIKLGKRYIRVEQKDLEKFIQERKR